MADREATIPLELPPDEAEAFIQFVKRIDYDTCARLANVTASYGKRAECDVMWSAVRMLLRQLAEAGFAPCLSSSLVDRDAGSRSPCRHGLHAVTEVR
jgi:hypothetical protein